MGLEILNNTKLNKQPNDLSLLSTVYNSIMMPSSVLPYYLQSR